jgi:alpha-tubulin suppressor-like RCC1 family protein
MRSSGRVFCWGSNHDGELGNGSIDETSVEPVRVIRLVNATQVVAGEAHSCALDEAGRVWCWGNNNRGASGDGTNTNRRSPVQVMNN